MLLCVVLSAVQASLNALQLSSALWSIARLGITPTETWLVRYSVCSFTALKVGPIRIDNMLARSLQVVPAHAADK